ncbi:hypothetical protein OPV22_017898 [Ensete ventricosum]|uniref:Transmembrane protein n=1 Tax=Ensete ventricosum TaxID=4639 RepID=A0AAV8QYA3_ENSVE|nr:hypothetical protein OPV22_017898 [Ensete ventricosum]
MLRSSTRAVPLSRSPPFLSLSPSLSLSLSLSLCFQLCFHAWRSLSSPLNLSPEKIKWRTSKRSELEVSLPKMEGRNLVAAKRTGNGVISFPLFLFLYYVLVVFLVFLCRKRQQT